MQAHLHHLETNLPMRPDFKHPVPLRTMARRFKYHDDQPEVWGRLVSNSNICFDLSQDCSRIEVACRDPEHLAHALGVMDAMADASKKRPGRGFERALYIIQVGEDPIVKVGISSNPYRRLRSLQDAHYRELFLWAVVFTPGKKAGLLEQLLLQWATDRGSRLHGEWVNEEPKDVFAEIVCRARDTGVGICNAEVWSYNLLRRTRRLVANPSYRRTMQQIALGNF